MAKCVLAPELQVFSFTPMVTHIYLAHVWTLHGVSDHEGHRKLSARTRYDMSGEKTCSLPLHCRWRNPALVLGFITVNLYSCKVGLQIEIDVLAAIASYQKNVQAQDD